MIRLAAARPGDVQPLLPAEPEAVLATLRAAAERLSPAHLALFAIPRRDEASGETIWEAPGRRAVAYADLDAENRARLVAEVGRLLSDWRREAERQRAEGGGPLAALWPLPAEIPSFAALFAVDGRPVLAPWGCVGAAAPGPLGLLARFDDGQPWSPPPRLPWGCGRPRSRRCRRWRCWRGCCCRCWPGGCWRHPRRPASSTRGRWTPLPA